MSQSLRFPFAFLRDGERYADVSTVELGATLNLPASVLKIALGADLRSAMPMVDLLRKVELIPEMDERHLAMHLAKAAPYLLTSERGLLGPYICTVNSVALPSIPG